MFRLEDPVTRLAVLNNLASLKGDDAEVKSIAKKWVPWHAGHGTHTYIHRHTHASHRLILVRDWTYLEKTAMVK